MHNKDYKPLGRNSNCIIIPTFNESEKIGEVVKSLYDLGWETIVVVDDGSTDASATIAHEAGAYVVSHMINRGAGAAVMTGLRVAQILDADSAVTFDADGQHDSQDVEVLVSAMETQGVDVVLGVRDFSSKIMPRSNKVANYIGNLFTWLIFRIYVNDSQSGLRAYSRRAMQTIQFDYQGYEYCSAIIGQIKQKKMKYAEVPIATRYSEYSTNKPMKQNLLNGVKTLIRLVYTPRI